MLRHRRVVVAQTASRSLLAEDSALIASVLARFHAHNNLIKGECSALEPSPEGPKPSNIIAL